MSRKALVLLVCCCDFRDGAERLIPSKSLGNAVIRAFPGLFRILRMCAPRHAAAVVRPRERKKSADRRRRILISRLLIIRASVPRRKSPFPAYFKGFPAVSLLIPPYPAFLKYPVSPQCSDNLTDEQRAACDRVSQALNRPDRKEDWRWKRIRNWPRHTIESEPNSENYKEEIYRYLNTNWREIQKFENDLLNKTE